MELNILHQAVAPSIIKFYGAFYTESCVHLCVEYMDAGSLDKLTAFTIGEQFQVSGETITWQGLPEEVLSRILGSTIRGLKFLKDKLEVIHRGLLNQSPQCSSSRLILLRCQTYQHSCQLSWTNQTL